MPDFGAWLNLGSEGRRNWVCWFPRVSVATDHKFGVLELLGYSLSHFLITTLNPGVSKAPFPLGVEGRWLPLLQVQGGSRYYYLAICSQTPDTPHFCGFSFVSVYLFSYFCFALRWSHVESSWDPVLWPKDTNCFSYLLFLDPRIWICS